MRPPATAEGAEAQGLAAEWGYDGDLEAVTAVRKSKSLACKWVWEGEEVGRCLACGDVDYSFLVEDDE